MALIPLKARSGIAALTFAAGMAPFVSATPSKRGISNKIMTDFFLLYYPQLAHRRNRESSSECRTK